MTRLQEAGKFAEAITLAQRALAIREKSLGPDHPEVGETLNDLGVLHGLQGRFAEAELLFRRSLAIREKVLGLEHPDVGESLNNLARVYEAQGRYGEVEALYRRSLAIREKALGPEHTDVSETLNNLGVFYSRQDRYDDAEALYRRSLSIREKALGAEAPEVGELLNNLAELYRTQGRYGEAESIYWRSIAIIQKALGSKHPVVATALNNLAGLHEMQGRYGEAEALYRRSLVISENVLGLEHPEVGMLLNNLALLYEGQGRNAEAEALYRRSLAISEKAQGLEHPDIGALLNNLAGLFAKQRRYVEADALYQRSLAIREKALGPEHTDVSESLNNLGALYSRQDRFGEAEPLYRRSLAISEKALGPDHPDVASSLNNLAELYGSQGRYSEAEQLHRRALAIYERTLGPDHFNVGISLNNLAWHALGQNDFAGAAEHWRRATAILQRRAERGLGAGLGESSKREIHRTSKYFEGLVKATQRLAGARHEDQVRVASEMFETAQWGLFSDAASSLAQMAARSAGGSPRIAALVREWQDLIAEWQGRDKLLVAARSNPAAKRNATAEKALSDRLASIDARLTSIDAQLGRDFPDYEALANPKPIGVSDVQADLRDDEALVLFLDSAEFKPLPEETFVWVVTKSELRWVRSEIGTKALQREVSALRCGLDATAWRASSSKCPELTGTTFTAQDRATGKSPPFDTARAYALYKALFGELEDLIKGKHLLLVPSGALTTLPFQVLVTSPPRHEKGKTISWLIRDHAITVLPSVTSLAALRRTGKPSVATKSMIGFGNPLLDGNQRHPQWGAEFKQLAAMAREQTGCATKPVKRTAALRALYRNAEPIPQPAGIADLAHVRRQSPLPETADELCEVARSLGANVSDVRIGARATEREVKRLSASGELAKFRIVHFATHGLLAGQLTGTSEPGLIMTPPRTGTTNDDGYLSGSEIASLKLDADWVILSACNTAGGASRGEAAEALSGLARVFFYAGARSLLVSHWEVDSATAVKLVTGTIGAMTIDKSLGRAEALRRAMLAAMIDTSRSTDRSEWHPSFWAPFVVVGEGGAGR